MQNNSLIHSTFKSSTDPLFKAVWEKVQRQGMGNSIFTQTNYSMLVQNENYVTSGDLSIMDLRVRLEYSTRSGESVLYVGKEGVYPSGLGIPMRKNAPFSSVINDW